MSKRRNSRIEQEINEILEKADLGSPESPPPDRRYRPSRRKLTVSDTQSFLSRVPSGLLWLGAVFGFALLAVLVSDWSQTLAFIFAILSIIAVFSPIYFWSRSAAPVATQQKEWRGRVIHLPPRQDGPIGKLKYKIWEIRNRSR